MAKSSLKGIVTSVSQVETVGTNNTRVQTLLLFKPGYINEYQEKVTQDEDWALKLLNSNIDKFNLLGQNLVNKKVEVEFYLNSRKYEDRNGVERFNIEARLAAITVTGEAQRTTGPASVTPDQDVDDDDLPF